jgi:hypothetical protein
MIIFRIILVGRGFIRFERGFVVISKRSIGVDGVAGDSISWVCCDTILNIRRVEV